jgi:hypothetical protein
MKNKKIQILFYLLVQQITLFGQFFPDPGDHGTLGEEKQIIKQGQNEADALPKAIRFTHVNRRYEYHLAFWNECWYDPNLYGCGWNKVGRVCYGNGGFGYNWHKLHVGWRASDNPYELRISAYFHDCNSEQYFSQELTTVHTDNQVYVDMFLGEHIVALIIDNVCFGARRKNYFPPNKTSYVSRTFYFGGNCTAPWDMAVLFYDQDHDETGFESQFNSRDIMTWNASEFEEGDIGEFYAYQLINGSSTMDKINASVTCYPLQKCIIKAGADITFSSGGSILLHPGFYAQSGSHFMAKIEQKTKPDSLKLDPIKVNLPSIDEYNFDSIKSSKISENLIGIEDIAKYNLFNIYPNPHPGIFSIEWNDANNSEYSIEIINMMGKLVYTKRHVLPGITEVDISGQAKGIYFVKLQAGDKVVTDKVVYQ